MSRARPSCGTMPPPRYRRAACAIFFAGCFGARRPRAPETLPDAPPCRQDDARVAPAGWPATAACRHRRPGPARAPQAGQAAAAILGIRQVAGRAGHFARRRQSPLGPTGPHSRTSSVPQWTPTVGTPRPPRCAWARCRCRETARPRPAAPAIRRAATLPDQRVDRRRMPQARRGWRPRPLRRRRRRSAPRVRHLPRRAGRSRRRNIRSATA